MADHGFPLLLIYNVDVDEWCNRYGLKVYSRPCKVCGRELTVNKPFAAEDMRGLTAGYCQCGDGETPFSYINVSFDRINLNSLCTSIENASPEHNEESPVKGRAVLRLVVPADS